MAVALWHRQWATYGWYPTFVPVVSIAPARVLAFDGSVQAIGNVVSMEACTATIVTALSVVPGFG
jgi:hypothetical protein